MTTLDSFLPKIKEDKKLKQGRNTEDKLKKQKVNTNEELDVKPIFKHKPRITPKLIRLAIDDLHYYSPMEDPDCVYYPIAFVDFSCLDECEDVDYCPIIIKLEKLAYNLKRKGQNLFRLIRQHDKDIALWLYWRALQLKCPKIWRRYKKQTR